MKIAPPMTPPASRSSARDFEPPRLPPAAARRRTDGARLLALGGIAILIVAATTLLGPQPVRWSEISGAERGLIFWQLRVPRALLAGAAGAGLAVGGAVFQMLFRNPLATPYTLGIASGASLAAAVGILLGVGASAGGRWLNVPGLAFAGALGATALIFLMARAGGGRDMTRLLLAGVCIASVGSAGVVLATYLADAAVTNQIVLWLLGSLATVSYTAVVQIGIVLSVILAWLVTQHRAFDVLALGDALAATRGVAVGRVVWLSLLAVSLLTAVIVAHCGPIAFVGLIVPHLVRGVLGARSLPLLIGSALLGAAFLAVCDGVARTLTNYEIPVGVLTAILGAAFFFALLIRQARGA